MKIALVSLGTHNYGWPFGLLCLAAWVRKNTDWEVNLLDANCGPVEPILLRARYDAIGISAMTQQWVKAVNLAKLLRCAKRGPVIVGGVHVSTCLESATTDFDVVLPHEGELKLTAWLRGGCTVPDEPISLKDYPDPAYDLLPVRYWERRMIRVWGRPVIQGTLITARGCPYSCRFCSTTQFWKSYRPHEAAWVVRQMRLVAERGVTHISIFDDLFTVGKHRLADIATRFEASGLRTVIEGISCLSRANTIDAETCDLLRSMNVQHVGFGFESGSDRVLKLLKKTGASVGLNKQAVRRCRAVGLRVSGSFMLGSPTETFGEMMKTARFILWCAFNGVEDLWPFVTTPYPGTEFWDIAVRRGSVSPTMDFSRLDQHGRLMGPAPLCDLSHWQWIVVRTLAQSALAVLSVIKMVRMLWRLTSLKVKRS